MGNQIGEPISIIQVIEGFGLDEEVAAVMIENCMKYICHHCMCVCAHNMSGLREDLNLTLTR